MNPGSGARMANSTTNEFSAPRLMSIVLIPIELDTKIKDNGKNFVKERKYNDGKDCRNDGIKKCSTARQGNFL